MGVFFCLSVVKTTSRNRPVGRRRARRQRRKSRINSFQPWNLEGWKGHLFSLTSFFLVATLQLAAQPVKVVELVATGRKRKIVTGQVFCVLAVRHPDPSDWYMGGKDQNPDHWHTLNVNGNKVRSCSDSWPSTEVQQLSVCIHLYFKRILKTCRMKHNSSHIYKTYALKHQGNLGGRPAGKKKKVKKHKKMKRRKWESESFLKTTQRQNHTGWRSQEELSQNFSLSNNFRCAQSSWLSKMILPARHGLSGSSGLPGSATPLLKVVVEPGLSCAVRGCSVRGWLGEKYPPAWSSYMEWSH